MPHLVFLGTLLVNPAVAADAPKLAIVGIHQQELNVEDQRRAAEALAETIASAGPLDPLEPDAVARAILGRESIILEEGLLGEARATLAAGRTLYNQADSESAIGELLAAIEDFEARILGTNATRDLWEAKVYLGASHLQLDDTEAAASAFRDAASLNPGRKPDANTFPPDVTGAYAAAAEQVAATQAVIEITTSHPGTVSLDGVDKGESPQTLAGVGAGTHHVAAHGDGRQGYATVTIDATTTSPLALKLDMRALSLGSHGTTAASRSRHTASFYRTLGRHTQGVDLLLLAGTSDGELHLQLYDTRTDAFSKTTSVGYGGGAQDEAVRFVTGLLNRLDADGSLPPDQTGNAAPLDLGTNVMLATLLLQPSGATQVAAPVSRTPRKRGGGSTMTIVGVSVGVAALAAGGIVLGTSLGGGEAKSDYGGTIVVGPF